MKETIEEYQRDEYRVHLIVYHLIWCPRRRKPILTGSIAKRCRELIEEKCKEKGWHILSLAKKTGIIAEGEQDNADLWNKIRNADEPSHLLEAQGMQISTSMAPLKRGRSGWMSPFQILLTNYGFHSSCSYATLSQGTDYVAVSEAAGF